MSSNIIFDNNSKYSFNNNLKKLFGEKCLISEFDIDECERAHIIPISICEQSNLDLITYNKFNGLILNRIFHIEFEIEGGKPPDFSLEFIGEDENSSIMDKYKIVLGGKYSNKHLLLNNYKNKIIKLYKKNRPFINFHKCIFDISNGFNPIINFNPNLLSALYLWKELNSNINYKSKNKKNKNIPKIKNKNIGKNKKIKNKITKYIPGNWEINKILDTRIISDKKEYLIEWKKSWVGKNSKIAKIGYIQKKNKNKVYVKWENTWEPSENIPTDIKKAYYNSLK